ncbi:hypothetical protein AGLY_001779 [Aphis glycines]|uniref:Uncharacterized protein n=1 Tax=Aphis glycines TaxID=307491 RepID=A0A6G0U5N8_APHGL|nr:hypothetical protein AGLY_001779 [Aphis glycines]
MNVKFFSFRTQLTVKPYGRVTHLIIFLPSINASIFCSLFLPKSVDVDKLLISCYGLISYDSLKDTNKFLLVPLMGEPTSINAAKVKNITLKSFGNEFMAESEATGLFRNCLVLVSYNGVNCIYNLRTHLIFAQRLPNSTYSPEINKLNKLSKILNWHFSSWSFKPSINNLQNTVKVPLYTAVILSKTSKHLKTLNVLMLILSVTHQYLQSPMMKDLVLKSIGSMCGTGLLFPFFTTSGIIIEIADRILSLFTSLPLSLIRTKNLFGCLVNSDLVNSNNLFSTIPSLKNEI